MHSTAPPSARSFLTDEEGATAIEYGLLVALVAIVLVGGLTALRLAMLEMYSSIETAVDGTMNG